MMTIPDAAAAPPPFDHGNQLLAETPAQQSVSVVQSAAGQRIALTTRTASTTLTVLLSKKEARLWAHNLKVIADQLSSSGLIVAQPGTPNGTVPIRDGQGT